MSLGWALGTTRDHCGQWPWWWSREERVQCVWLLNEKERGTLVSEAGVVLIWTKWTYSTAWTVGILWQLLPPHTASDQICWRQDGLLQHTFGQSLGPTMINHAEHSSLLAESIAMLFSAVQCGCPEQTGSQWRATSMLCMFHCRWLVFLFSVNNLVQNTAVAAAAAAVALASMPSVRQLRPNNFALCQQQLSSRWWYRFLFSF